MHRIKYVAAALIAVAGLGFQQAQALPVVISGFGQQSDLTELAKFNNDANAVGFSVPADAHQFGKHRKPGRRGHRHTSVAPTPNPSAAPGGHGIVPPIPDPIPHGTVPPIPNPIPHGTVPPIPDPIPHGTVPPIPNPIPQGTVPPIPDPIPQGTVPPIPDPILSTPPGGPGSGPGAPSSTQVHSVPEGGSTFVFLGLYLMIGELLRRIVSRRAVKI
jgi:hypothetical protein